MNSKRILCVGGMNVDFIFQVSRAPVSHEKLRAQSMLMRFGGAAANTAHWLARLKNRVEMHSAVGDDSLGVASINALHEAGVDVSHVQRIATATTGVAAVVIEPHGEKRMITGGDADRYMTFSKDILDAVGSGTHIHVAGGPDEQVLPLMRDAGRRGASISCELNGVQNLERVSLANLVFLNWDELSRWFGPEPIARWRCLPDAGKTTLIVTRGGDGATAVTGTNDVEVPTNRVQVVDRTGGGDAFDAAFLSAWIMGSPIRSCIERGLRLAALVISQFGPRPMLTNNQMMEIAMERHEEND